MVLQTFTSSVINPTLFLLFRVTFNISSSFPETRVGRPCLSLAPSFLVGRKRTARGAVRRSGAEFNTVGDRRFRPSVRPLQLPPLFPSLTPPPLSASQPRSLAASLPMSKMCREPRSYIQNLCRSSLPFPLFLSFPPSSPAENGLI